MFPQLGAPIGFVFSGSVFLFLSRFLTNEQFFQFGWRIPFLASATLVAIGLYVRLTITETPIFAEAMKKEEQRAKVPALVVFRDHAGTLVLGTMISIIAYTLFYMHASSACRARPSSASRAISFWSCSCSRSCFSRRRFRSPD
jgi:MFS family permease